MNKKTTMIVALIAAVMFLSGCVNQETLNSPIFFEGGFFQKYIVYPVSWLLYQLTDLTGGSYAIGILLTTLVVRSAAWPIYARTNDMNIKMQAMQPEQAKIQKKYEGKTDRDSQMRQQQEIQALYKKYGVNPLGCLLPFLQMPIFLAIYYAVRRIPHNVGTGILDLGDIDASTTILGMDLLKVVSEEFSSNFLYLLIPLFTAATMFLVQWMAQKRSKKNQANVPEYRKNDNAANMQKQMQMMMYFMVIMMAFVAWQSPAALGFYWIIGNIYSLLQTTINYRRSDKKMKELGM
jgi:YidC/Oxa1 family membrane protein insertase